MHQVILFDDPAIRGSLLPFTFTRPVGEIRVGILTIKEKWERHLKVPMGYFTQEYLKEKFGHADIPSLFINGALCPNPDLLSAIKHLEPGQALWHGATLLALPLDQPQEFSIDLARTRQAVRYDADLTLVQKSGHIFHSNGKELRSDFDLITAGRASKGISDPATVTYNAPAIFVEEGAHVRAAVLNAENGPIYIGKNARIEEGALIRGPFALCEGSTVNMGAKMRGDTTVGPFSKIGGEVSNSVIFGYSNKGHEGFLGNSVIGEWCNFGADSNTSNLKNNYASVKLWDYIKGSYVDTGLQFCGLMMGDHSKCGINTMFNTGTVVGVAANIFGAGYPRNFITSFAWGGPMGFSTHNYKKFEETAAKVMERRGLQLDDVEKKIYRRLFELTQAYRIWDKDI
jgi:UDP-N-acetylglucosamine diphosphorylase/glucosamine-1-phosphate N-acetyltransferase